MPDTSLTGPFASLPDPRGHRGRQYSLTSLITIAVSAAIRAAEDWVAAFGRAKADWFRTFLDLPDDTPSHDTFDRVFARIDREG
ncbi:MAG: transposase family protein, partial [Phycisphaerales bacterium]